jgi:hypothetical protein
MFSIEKKWSTVSRHRDEHHDEDHDQAVLGDLLPPFLLVGWTAESARSRRDSLAWLTMFSLASMLKTPRSPRVAGLP